MTTPPTKRNLLARIIPPRTVFIRTGERISHRELSPRAQLIAGLSFCGMVFGGVYLFSIAVIDSVATPVAGVETEIMQAAYEQRIDALIVERNRLRAALQNLEARNSDALAALDAQNLSSVTLQSTLADQSDQLARVTAERDRLAEALASVTALADATAAERDDLALRLANTLSTKDDLERAVERLAQDTLRRAEDARSLSTAFASLEAQVDSLSSEKSLLRQQQERVYTRLEDAVDVGLETLEGVFKRAGTDVEALLGTMRDGFMGRGGPEVPLDPNEEALLELSLPTWPYEYVEAPAMDRADYLMEDLNRLNTYREVFETLPFGQPVLSRHRQTSGFGPRRDPFTRRMRQHNGLDFAAPRGTPIYSVGEGTVIMAGTLGAFGRIVKIRHDFGYETLYAHMHRIRVQRGDRVERGDRIGDMGSTGRSTGTHLHYEIHKDGRAVDPINYLRAARDVL